jgi:2-polyprenyl-6-methoxyphenol hydroxylase-like FAD-dependent oxidoreductase
VCDHWYEDALVQRVPDPSGPGVVLRITARHPDLPGRRDEPRESPSPGHSSDLGRELTGVDPRPVRQTDLRNGDADRTRWAGGRVSFCGAAVCPAAPASGVRISFGIEDALAFVAELTRESRPAADAVEAYADRRHRRLRDLRRTAERVQADRESPTPAPPNASVASLGVFRTVALGPFTDPTLAALRLDDFR